MRGRVLGTLARGLAVVGAIVAILAVRAVTASRAELARGDALRAGGDPDGAILAYRRAARWYAPGNPYVDEALDRLAGLAVEAERGGEAERALAAWRSIRGGILATRSFYVPHEARLRRAEVAIARLTAEAVEPSGRAGERRRVLRELQRPERPRVGYSLLALFGWLAWTGGAFVFAQVGLDEEDRVRRRPARLLGAIVAVGFGLFVLGLALA